MDQIAGWVAPAATMIAAMMTAANLGTRVTGWGFVVFVVGSIAWSVVGLTSGQTNLLLSNAFLLVVNIVGVWRWLGRQATYEDGSRAAAARSARARVPTLFSAGGLIGAGVTGPDGAAVGTVVDAMLRCDGRDIAYVVLGRGGVAGLGEELVAVDPHRLVFGPEGVATDLTRDELARLPVLEDGNWPEALPPCAPRAVSPAGGRAAAT